MQPDVVDLRQFYDSHLGHIVRRTMRQHLRTVWPYTRGLRVLGVGYASPYLIGFREGSERVLAFMTARQGAHRWPANEPGLVALVEDTELPLPEASMDRVLLVHALEHSEHTRAVLREIWRVMAPEGRLLIRRAQQARFVGAARTHTLRNRPSLQRAATRQPSAVGLVRSCRHAGGAVLSAKPLAHCLARRGRFGAAGRALRPRQFWWRADCRGDQAGVRDWRPRRLYRIGAPAPGPGGAAGWLVGPRWAPRLRRARPRVATLTNFGPIPSDPSSELRYGPLSINRPCSPKRLAKGWCRESGRLAFVVRKLRRSIPQSQFAAQDDKIANRAQVDVWRFVARGCASASVSGMRPRANNCQRILQ